MTDAQPEQDLKSQLYKEIGKQMIQKEGEFVFVPRAQSCFLSDDFGQLPRAAQLHELGVHQITSSANQFTPHDYDFTSLYESFISEGGFELQGKDSKYIQEYLAEMKKKRDKIDPKTLELMDKFELLQDEYDDLEEDEREGNQGKKLARKLKQVKKLLREKEADQMLEESGDKDPDIERLRKAIKKFLIYKKSYEIDPRAGEQMTWDEDTYVDVDLTPGNFASMLKTDENGINKSTKYEEFSTSTKRLRDSASSESTSWNASLDISYSIFSAEGSVSSSNTQSLSESSLSQLQIEMKLTSIQVTRKWFDIQLFSSDKIGSKGDKQGSWSSQRCPYLIESVVIAKDVMIEGIQQSSEEKAEAKQFSANAKVSVMGFGGGSGGYSSSSSSSSSSFDYEKGTYKCTAPHIVGYLCRPFPQFPRFDSAQAEQVIPKKPNKTDVETKYGALQGVQHLDQKKTNFCVRAAIATAVSAQVPRRTDYQVQIDQQSLYKTLIGIDAVKGSNHDPNLKKQLSKAESGTDPKNFNLQYIPAWNTQEEPFRIKILIRELAPEIVPFDDEDGSKYLLGYDQFTQAGVENQRPSYHCVAVDEIRRGKIIGFNSWGSTDPKPQMDIGGKFVTVWQILVQEVKELDVSIPEDERENLATDLGQDILDLFDNSTETQGASFCDLFGSAAQDDVEKDNNQVDSTSFSSNNQIDSSSKRIDSTSKNHHIQSQQDMQVSLRDQTTTDRKNDSNEIKDVQGSMGYVNEMEVAKNEVQMYLQASIDGTDVNKVLMPYTQKANHPVVQYRQNCIEVPKPHQFDKKENGYTVAMLIQESCVRWDRRILRFLTELANLGGAIKAIKLDIENLSTQLKRLKVIGNFVTNKDFENQFESLNTSVSLFKGVLDRIYAINDSCQLEVNGSDKDMSELDEEAQKIEKQRKELNQKLHTLQTEIFDTEINLDQFEHQKEAYQLVIEKARTETNELLNQECEARAQLKTLQHEIAQLTEERKTFVGDSSKVQQEVDQIEKSLSAWSGREQEIQQDDHQVEAEDLFAQQKQEKHSWWVKQIDDVSSTIYSLLGNKSDVNAPSATHFTFLCDSSGSVSDSDFKKMMEGISNLVNSRKALSSAQMDRYSLILFTGAAHKYYLDQSVTKGFQPPARISGGTDFNEAFKCCCDVVQVHKAPNQVIIFMTDGQGPHDQVEGYFKTPKFINSYSKWRSLRLFCVAYGGSCNNSVLEKICRAGNGGQIQDVLPDWVIDYIHHAQDGDSLKNTYNQISNQLDAQEAHLQKQIESKEKTKKQMQEQFDKEMQSFDNLIVSEKNRVAQTKESKLQFCKEQQDKLQKKQLEYKQQLSELASKINGIDIKLANNDSILKSEEPKLTTIEKKRETTVKNLEQNEADLDQLNQDIIQERKKAAHKALEAAKAQVENTKNFKLFNSHYRLEETQRKIMIFITEFKIQASLIDQAVRSASYYISQGCFFDEDKAVILCLTKLASIYEIPFEEKKIRTEFQKYFIQILEKIFDSKKSQKFTSKNDLEIAQFLGTHFQVQEFLHEELGLMMPQKNKKQNKMKDDGDDDSEEENIQDKAKAFFGANAVQKWKKSVKQVNKRIEKQEGQIEKLEEKIDKEEDKNRPNQKTLDDLSQKLQELKLVLKEQEDALKNLERQEDDVAEQAEAGKEKVSDFKNKFKELQRALKHDAVGEISFQSLDNVSLNLYTFARGVIGNLQAMEEAIPKIVSVMKSAHTTDPADDGDEP